MNWTGGRIHRHSKRTSGAIRNRQRQHFAKIRAQPPQDRLSGPCPLPSNFGYSVPAGEKGAFRPERLRLRSNDEIGGLEYIGASNSFQHERGKRRSASEDPKTKLKLNVDTQRSPPQARGGQNENDRSSIVKRQKLHNSELFGALDQKSEALAAETLNGQWKEAGSEQNIEAKKARLLERMNWTGLDKPCLAAVKLLSAECEGNMARRRRVPPKSQENNVNANETAISQTTENDGDQKPKSEKFMSGALPSGAEEIRIRVGCDVISSKRFKIANESTLPDLSSNIMLFEDDYIASRDTQQSPRGRIETFVSLNGYSDDRAASLHKTDSSMSQSSSSSTAVQQTKADMHFKMLSAQEEGHGPDESGHILASSRAICRSLSTSQTQQSCQVNQTQKRVSSLGSDREENVVSSRLTNSAANDEGDWAASPLPCIGRYPSTGPYRWLSGSTMGSLSALNFRVESHDIMQQSVSEVRRVDNGVGRRGFTAMLDVGCEKVLQDVSQLSTIAAQSPVTEKKSSDDIWRKFVFGNGKSRPAGYGFRS
jgi:hypothetical protein